MALKEFLLLAILCGLSSHAFSANEGCDLVKKSINKQWEEKPSKYSADETRLQTGDIDTLSFLVIAGKNVELKRELESMPHNQDSLSIAVDSAALFGNTEAIEDLIAHGADINNRTPLVAAAQCQEDRSFDILLDKGADPYHETEKGIDALSASVLYGYERGAEVLFSRGYDYCKNGFDRMRSLEPNKDNRRSRTLAEAAKKRGLFDLEPKLKCIR
jgi:ankyrin repeat protein